MALGTNPHPTEYFFTALGMTPCGRIELAVSIVGEELYAIVDAGPDGQVLALVVCGSISPLGLHQKPLDFLILLGLAMSLPTLSETNANILCCSMQYTSFLRVLGLTKPLRSGRRGRVF